MVTRRSMDWAVFEREKRRSMLPTRSATKELPSRAFSNADWSATSPFSQPSSSTAVASELRQEEPR